ncbi:hypothetical protein DW722_07000 [Mediterraneibacter gnavus]|jgi:hypothetical protein|uniref:hypothetical protein n=1 Tax=Mediterraneibacter gnavus TaxID=33038 RepID=UPI000E4F3DD1|nr:hypothetical protein [Mediterraneibacter gnavus]RHE72389.1 hypothetical protein DW722_07000 [Mediterraneibacter gnavus]
MIKEFCLAWEKNKDKLEEYFRKTRQEEYGNYEDLVKLLFDIVINPSIECDHYRLDTENILVIDDGDYQGTQVFILHRDQYQPSVEDYVYTNTYYGSCSGCDTLLSINEYEDGLPSESQVNDYMDLCLHLLQRCHYMIDEEE